LRVADTAWLGVGIAANTLPAILFFEFSLFTFVSLSTPCPHVRAAFNQIRERFGSVAAANQFFRMYLRDLPETISKTTITDETPTSYDELDGKPRPKTLAEAKRIVTSSEI
jgi:hypothetical protein